MRVSKDVGVWTKLVEAVFNVLGIENEPVEKVTVKKAVSKKPPVKKPKALPKEVQNG